jgi:hypothetical protein
MTSGCFLAPFLEHEAHLSVQRVAVTLAVFQAVLAMSGSVGGAVADHVERRYLPGQGGRAVVMGLGIGAGTVVFLLHDMHSWRPQSAFFKSFPWFVFLRCAYAISISLVFPVLEGMTLSFLKEESCSSETDYGKERLFGAVSWAMAHMVLALSLDLSGGFGVVYPWGLFSTGVVFFTLYIYVGGERDRNFALRTAPSDNTVEFVQEPPLQNRPASVSFVTLVRLLVQTPYAVSFLLAVCSISVGQVVVDSLIFLYFEFLQSTYSVMGLTVLLTVAFETPIFYIAPMLLHRVGSGVLLVVAAACYCVRVVGYSFIPVGHVGYALSLEPLHGITYACVQTAVVDFAARSTPKGYEASTQGIVFTVRGFGSVIGLLWGGWATAHIGSRDMYRINAGFVMLGNTLLAYYLHQGVSQSPMQEKDVQNENVELMESNHDTESSADG